jgi:hypothetical protein
LAVCVGPPRFFAAAARLRLAAFPVKSRRPNSQHEQVLHGPARVASFSTEFSTRHLHLGQPRRSADRFATLAVGGQPDAASRRGVLAALSIRLEKTWTEARSARVAGLRKATNDMGFVGIEKAPAGVRLGIAGSAQSLL